MQLEDNTIQITLILCVYVMRINSYFYSLLCFMHESSTCVIYITPPPPFRELWCHAEHLVVPLGVFIYISSILCVIYQLVCQSNKAAYIALK